MLLNDCLKIYAVCVIFFLLSDAQVSVPSLKVKSRKPTLGPATTNGSKPLWGYSHIGTDAIFALACNYRIMYYRRFVGSLRKVGYTGDIVLAVSPPEKMQPFVYEYLQEMHVISYAFDVDCQGKDNCKFKDEFLG